MYKPRFLLFALAALIFAGLACDETGSVTATDDQFSTSVNVVPKGNRILELDANASENEDFDQAIKLAKELGAESIRLSVYWDDIETAPGNYNPDPNWLAIADQYYSAQGLSISLVISVLDTTEIRVPEDLKSKSFADPYMGERFIGLLDYVNSQLKDVDLISLAIGNEIDGFLGTDQAAWQAYQIFFETTSAYARELWPTVPVSTKVTFDGLTGSMGETARGIYQNTDVVMTTYYPLKGDFSVKSPDVILEDFQILVEMFPDQEIHITEIGYPTSKTNHSSPEKQAEFITYMFQAWDEGVDQIRVLSYSWLTDLPQSSVQELETYYGLSNKSFGEFLRTLGLRTYPGAGENKAGFGVFKGETRSRGWK